MGTEGGRAMEDVGVEIRGMADGGSCGSGHGAHGTGDVRCVSGLGGMVLE